MTKRLLLIVLVAIVGTACQNEQASQTQKEAAAEVFDKATKPLYIRFYLRYLDKDKRLKSTVNFYQQADGQQKGVEMEKPVRVDGRDMKFKNLRDIELRYEDLYDVPAKDEYTFNFETFDGNTQTYTAKLPRINAFSVDAGVKKSTGFTLQADAPDLEEQEVLLLMFTDGDRNTETLTIFGPMEMQQLPVSAEAVKNLTLGRNELRLVRKRTDRLKAKNYSGEY
ncbi:MAG: hypothetical protein AAF738_05840, partial [Bacteroidota bacterium]